MRIKSLPLGPLGTNCYIVFDEKNALIFDPGAESEKVIKLIESLGVTPRAILLTHAHFDHIGAVDPLRNHYSIDVYLHKNEAGWLETPPSNSMGLDIKTKKPEHFLSPGPLEIASFSFHVEHTPGHSPGSVSFIFKDQSFIISGDVLFRQGVGRTDLVEGSFAQLENSIRNILYRLPDSYIVYPGHGVATSIGWEKENNLYVPAING